MSLKPAQKVCHHCWNSPLPEFTSGKDIRTSDNGLLVLTYGNLHQSAKSQWLNAGRSLIDKTYIQMLWHVQSLTHIQAIRAENVAAALDNFIREEIQPLWADLYEMDNVTNCEVSIELVKKASISLFGSLQSEEAASKLLFFLCPMLTVFNFSTEAIKALQHLGHDLENKLEQPSKNSKYEIFHHLMTQEFGNIQDPLSEDQCPTPFYGDTTDQSLIQETLNQTDWWQRRVFDEYLKHLVTTKNHST